MIFWVRFFGVRFFFDEIFFGGDFLSEIFLGEFFFWGGFLGAIFWVRFFLGEFFFFWALSLLFFFFKPSPIHTKKKNKRWRWFGRHWCPRFHLHMFTASLQNCKKVFFFIFDFFFILPHDINFIFGHEIHQLSNEVYPFFFICEFALLIVYQALVGWGEGRNIFSLIVLSLCFS